MTQRIPPSARRHCATAAMAGACTYALVDVALQRLPPHYSPIRDAESDLAVGPYGWIMNLNFLGRAVTTFCTIGAISRTGPASGLRRTGTVLMGAGGVCSAVLAFFATDIVVPGEAVTTTARGAVHLRVAGTGFAAALGALMALTAWLRKNELRSTELSRTYPVALACTVTAAVGLVSLGLSGRYAPRLLGLAERICLGGILGWVFVVGAGIRRLG